METTVRYIPTEVAVVDGRSLVTGNKPALCFRGKTHALGIVNDETGIIPVELSLRDHDESPLVLINNRADEYPVSKFITHLTRIMAEKPISPEALRLIKDWPNNGEDFDSEKIEYDEPVIKHFAKKKPKTTCIASLATEYKISPQKVRKFLRSKGLHAPYVDEKKIRSIMKTFKKG